MIARVEFSDVLFAQVKMVCRNRCGYPKTSRFRLSDFFNGSGTGNL